MKLIQFALLALAVAGTAHASDDDHAGHDHITINATLTSCREYKMTGSGNQASPTKKCGSGAGEVSGDWKKGECYRTCDIEGNNKGYNACFRNHYDHMTGKHKTQIVDAGCGHDTETCKIAQGLGVKANACSTCKVDECNSGGMVKPSLAAALVAILAVLGYLA